MSRPLTSLVAAIALAATAALVVRAQPGASQPPGASGVQPVAFQPTAQPAAPESLDGTWELVSVIEDGKVVPLDIIRATMIKDARVVIKGPVAAVIRPDGKFQTLAFVTDPKASPKTLDLAGAKHIGGKSIYMRDGDTLMVCTRGSDADTRPTMMASLPGSDTFLMSFKRVEVPAPAKLAPPPPPPAVLPAEAAVAKILVGTWGHQTDELIVKVTLNADATFTMVTTNKKGLKKVFDHEERTSGKWLLKDGNVTLSASASTERSKIGQVYSYRITSISDSEVLYVDNLSGQRRIEWKLR